MIGGRYEPLAGDLARDVELGRTVRIRWLDRPPPDVRLSHPNVVRVYDVGEHDGRTFAAVEHVDGRPLTALAPLPADEAAAVGRQACRALAAAHELGLVHVGELLVRADGVAKLSGFEPGEPGADVRRLAVSLADASPELPPLEPADTAALARGLERLRPPAPTVRQPPAVPRRRRPAPLVLAVAAALAIAGGVAGIVAGRGGETPPQPVVRVTPVPHARSAEQQARALAAWLSRWSR